MTPTAVNATTRSADRVRRLAEPRRARDVRKTFATRDGELPVLEGIDLRGAGRRDRGPARTLGLGQVDAPAHASPG